MYGNTRFRGASKAATPQFASAAARQGQAENQAQMQENSQLSNNLMGAAQLYNDGMGDKAPLYDMMEEAFGGGGETVAALRSSPFPMTDSQIADQSQMIDFGQGGQEIASQMAQEQMQQKLQEELLAKQAASLIGGG